MNDMMVTTTVQPSLHERATRIRSLVDVTRGCIIEIGRELIAAKAEVGHGQWLRWLDDEFGWATSTADNYMLAARKFPTLGNMTGLAIDATALYALSSPDVPQAVRAEALKRAQDGEQVSKADADAMIAKAEAAIEAELLTAFNAQRVESAKEMKKSLSKAEKRYADDTLKLTEEIARIKAAQRDPDVPQAIEMFCKILGKPKLNAKQMRLLAQVIEAPITDGTRTYQPVSEIDRQAAEANLAVAAAAERALDYFAIAPAPAEVAAAMQPMQRTRVAAKIGSAVTWLEQFGSL